MLCNVHLICIYNTALQQVMIIQTEPGDISMPISFPFSFFPLKERKNLFFLKIFFFSIATSNQWNFSQLWGDCIWAQLSVLSLSKWVPRGSKWPSSLHHTVHKVVSVQDMTKRSIFNSVPLICSLVTKLYTYPVTFSHCIFVLTVFLFSWYD